VGRTGLGATGCLLDCRVNGYVKITLPGATETKALQQRADLKAMCAIDFQEAMIDQAAVKFHRAQRSEAGKRNNRRRVGI
jgi:hypothetical protein